VIVDQLTTVAHFIPVKTTYSEPQLAELYMSRIVCLHGVPKKIASDRGTQFTSKFWERLHEALGTQLCFSFVYHLLMHFSVEARTREYFREGDQRAMPWLTRTV
jgi:transposase InsO family protein